MGFSAAHSGGNGRGDIRATLAVTDVIRAGAVALAGQWWSEPVETGATANLLSPSAWSPGGQPAYNDTFIDVEAAEGRSKDAASPHEATIDFS